MIDLKPHAPFVSEEGMRELNLILLHYVRIVKILYFPVLILPTHSFHTKFYFHVHCSNLLWELTKEILFQIMLDFTGGVGYYRLRYYERRQKPWEEPETTTQ